MFRPPCVQRSGWDAMPELEPPGAPGHAPIGRVPGGPRRAEATSLARAPAGQAITRSAVRVGLSRVFGLERATGERILRERERCRFGSLADFTDRVRATLPEIESLVLAGAFDWTGRTRPSLLLEARAGAASWKRPPRPMPVLGASDGAALALEAVAPLPTPALPEFEPAERVRHEVRATGLWFSAHPLRVWVAPEAKRGVTPAARVPDRPGAPIAVVGLPCARRRVETKAGESMLFLTLADETGLIECVLFPDAYRAWAHLTRGEALRVEGRVDEALGAVTLAVARVEALAQEQRCAQECDPDSSSRSGGG